MNAKIISTIKFSRLSNSISYGVYLSKENVQDFYSALQLLKQDTIPEIEITDRDIWIKVTQTPAHPIPNSNKSTLYGRSLCYVVDEGFVDYWIEICGTYLQGCSSGTYEPYWDTYAYVETKPNQLTIQHVSTFWNLPK